MSDYYLKKAIEEYKQNNLSYTISSKIMDLSLLCGGKIVQAYGGVVLSIADYKDDFTTGTGFSTGIILNLPTKSIVSPYANFGYTQIEKTGMFNLGVGISLGEKKKG